MSMRLPSGLGTGMAVALCGSLLVGCGAADDGNASVTEDGAASAETQSALSRATQSAGASSSPLAVFAVAPPEAVPTSDGRRHLLYELVLQNLTSTAVRVDRLLVSDAARHASIADFQGEALNQIFVTDGNAPSATDVLPGAFALTFVDLSFAVFGSVPNVLRHTFTSRVNGRSRLLAALDVPVEQARPIELGPPLRGSHLVDLNGCCNSIHTRALLAVDGKLANAQRFAIDFLRARGNTSFAGDPGKNESYFLYGADVLAAAGGQIVAARDGMAENVPPRPLDADVETAPGNYLVEQIDEGHYALYAHLKPSSLRVRVGDRVRRGQVLGAVGNSGESTEPHLHFQVMDGPVPLAQNGLPYVFDCFELEARVDDAPTGPVLVPAPGPKQRRHQLPMNLDVVGFPERCAP